ncbi:MAG TPA: heme-binding protein [Stellaceae bacterium]|nr:heme-binding protein [Stellaceae bacterium]
MTRKIHVVIGILMTTCIMGGGGREGARANDLLITHRLPAALALEAVSEAVNDCARKGYAVTAVVVDSDGVRQASLRGDRAGVHTADSAYGKAYTAVSLAPISHLDSSAEAAKTFLANPAAASLQHVPNILLLGGGLTILAGDEVIGAIGVGGAPGGMLDEACARTALDKIRPRIN